MYKMLINIIEKNKTGRMNKEAWRADLKNLC